MVMTHSNRAVAGLVGAAIAVGAQAIACQAGPSGAAWATGASNVVQHATGATEQAATIRYWTPARMGAALNAASVQSNGGGGQAARPADQMRRLIRRVPTPQASRTATVSGSSAGPSTGDTEGNGLRWTGQGAVAAAIGKIFFTLGSQDYVCSGALVGGKHPDVVLTAAHCVTSGPGKGAGAQWATNWMFVPGYADGRSPYGEYTARRFLVSPDWTGPESGREQYDTAFVQVATATVYGAAGPGVSGTAEPPPGLPVAFGAEQAAVPFSQTYLFGYPSELPYNGLYLNYCAGRVAAADGSVRTACGMTAGDSGGPWLAGFSPRSGSGTIAAVSTYKVSSNARVLYGAVLGPEARALYQRAVTRTRLKRTVPSLLSGPVGDSFNSATRAGSPF
jgi:V8-like Glu-specific endopeptidase